MKKRRKEEKQQPLMQEEKGAVYDVCGRLVTAWRARRDGGTRRRRPSWAAYGGDYRRA